MQIDSPLQMNDWKIKKFFRVILSIQLAMWGVVGLDAINLQVPILRQLIGFIYLTFLPGVIILRILRLHKLDNIETLLYTVGLSISFIMFSGMFINSLLLFIGISKPISLIPLLILNNIIIIILCFVCYLRDKDYSVNDCLVYFYINTDQLLSFSVLFSLLLSLLFPILSVYGAYLLRIHDNNYILLCLLAIISVIPILVGFDKLPKNIYPVVIWSVAFSLLSHVSFTQINSLREDYMPHVVLTEGAWIPHLHDPQNALLSDTILQPIFSIVLGLDIIWSVRIVNSLLFSFIPLAMYSAFKTFTNEKNSFFSSFLFMSIFYFSFLPIATRRGTPLLFLALVLLVLVSEKISKQNRSALLLVFTFSIITSHYGTSYIFMFSLISALFLALLGQRLGYWNLEMMNLASITFVSFYVTLAISWYIYVANSSNLEWIVRFGEHIINSINDFLSPESSNVIYTLTTRELPFSINVIKYLLIIIVICMIIGILNSFKKLLLKQKSNIPYEYLILSIGFSVVSLITFLPVGGQSNIIAFIIFLVFPAPFCIIGIEIIINNITKYFQISSSKNLNKKLIYAISSLFIFIFFIFNYGLISEIITKGSDYSPNIIISSTRIEELNNIYAKAYFYGQHIPIYDIYTQDWIIRYKVNTIIIYCDRIIQYSRFRLVNLEKQAKGEKSVPAIVLNKDSQLDGYILLGYHNLVDNIMFQKEIEKSFGTNELQIENKNKIYSNGGGIIYYS